MRLTLLLALLALAGCSSTPPSIPQVDLTRANALRAQLPAAVDTFAFVGDQEYRGFFETDEGPVGVLTVSGTYRAPSGQEVAISLSSFDHAEAFVALVGGNEIEVAEGEPPAYAVLLGRILLAGEHHAAEAKSFRSAAVDAALASLDLARIGALPTETMLVDSTFVRRDRRSAPADSRDEEISDVEERDASGPDDA